jgi:transposase
MFADGGYVGDKLASAISHIEDVTVEIVKRSDVARSFVVLPKHWVVERTFGRLGRCRRLARDWEASIASSEAWLLRASIRGMTRDIARA